MTAAQQPPSLSPILLEVPTSPAIPTPTISTHHGYSGMEQGYGHVIQYAIIGLLWVAEQVRGLLRMVLFPLSLLSPFMCQALYFSCIISSIPTTALGGSSSYYHHHPHFTDKVTESPSS